MFIISFLKIVPYKYFFDSNIYLDNVEIVSEVEAHYELFKITPPPLLTTLGNSQLFYHMLYCFILPFYHFCTKQDYIQGVSQ